jgi:ATP-dependent DNA ligase
VNGISDFNALHSGKQNAEVQLCAFDVLAIDGEDVRDLPLSMRKANLERSHWIKVKNRTHHAFDRVVNAKRGA